MPILPLLPRLLMDCAGDAAPATPADLFLLTEIKVWGYLWLSAYGIGLFTGLDKTGNPEMKMM